MKELSGSLGLILLLVGSLAGHAQSRNPNEMATNLPAATTFAAPPEGFDVLAASDERLADFGFPPRPDQMAQPKAYASWARAMRASRRRIVPALVQTNTFHGPIRLKQAVEKAQEDTLLSSNWSGYVDLNGSTRYGTTAFAVIASDLVVPTANEAFGTCSPTVDYGSSWVGMDGDGSKDVLQSGIEFDAACFGGVLEAFYAPWIEWYPAGELRITNLPISPGDDLFIEVWNTSATQGYAYLVNENANLAVTVNMTPPAGTKLIGNSAEWITERPQANGTTATLTNYIADPFWDSYGVTHSNRGFDPGSSEAIIMLDDNDVEISYPTLLGESAFLMQNTGSSR